MKQIKVDRIIQAKDDDGIVSKNAWGNAGKFVSVRPCAEKYENKTFLGLYLGDLALGLGTTYNEEKKELSLHHSFYNPAIFVFATNEIIFGCGSWWEEIKDETDLKKITDADINNIWYVKAMRQIEKVGNHD
jgi:hypothetical protein